MGLPKIDQIIVSKDGGYFKVTAYDKDKQLVTLVQLATAYECGSDEPVTVRRHVLSRLRRLPRKSHEGIKVPE
jgi:hypothetical protein